MWIKKKLLAYRVWSYKREVKHFLQRREEHMRRAKLHDEASLTYLQKAHEAMKQAKLSECLRLG